MGRWCRLCAVKITNQNNTVNLSDLNAKKLSIDEMLKIFQNLPLSSNRLSNTACTSCFKDLEFCYKFYVKLLQSTALLLKLNEAKVEGFLKIAPKPDSVSTSHDSSRCTRKSMPRRYVCEECSASFKSHRQLVSHHKIHEPDQACHYCGSLYLDSQTLENHVWADHVDCKYWCNSCDSKFPSRNLLLRHRKNLHNVTQRQYNCVLCKEAKEILVGKEDADKHIKAFHIKDFKAEKEVTTVTKEDEMEPDMIEEFLDYMDEEFLDDFLMNQDQNSFCWDEISLTHLDDDCRTPTPKLVALKEGRYKCPQCDEFFKAQKNLLQHLAHVHGDYVLYCNKCGLAFNRLSKLKEHFNSHIKESNNDKHKKAIEPTEKNSRQCSLCNMTYKTQAGLKYHLRTHSNAKVFICPYCKKSFIANINLNAHIRNVHADIKPNLCTLCDRKFSSVDHLKKHVSSVHQKERNHLCSVCGKSFSQASHLKQHLLIHTGEKPFKCGICGLASHKKCEVVKHTEKHHQSQ